MQTCIWPSRCHCHSLSLASVKSRLVLPFWYRLTRVVPQKGPLNGCMCVCVCVCDDLTPENALCLDVYCDAYLTCCLCYTLAKYKQIGVKYTPCSNQKTTLYFARYPGTRSYHNAATSHGSVRASIIHRLTCVKFRPVRRGGGRGRGRTGQVGRDGYHTPIRDLDHKKNKAPT